MARKNSEHLDHKVVCLVGVSQWAEAMRERIRCVAAAPCSALITGPTGTGKELIAQSIHFHSERASKPFVPVDCAAATGTLFASHIFGHRKGAFTDAQHESPGCFRAADGGTVFLDEIGDLDLTLQAKLLRVLQERVVVPVGDHMGIPVDVRVIAATNQDLQKAVAEGTFREDLFYRLNVVSLTTLPLWERPEDISSLAECFLEGLADRSHLPLRRLSPAALEQLQRYHWPGNVRQLKNVLERAVIFGHDDPLDADVIREMLSDQPDYAPMDTFASSAVLLHFKSPLSANSNGFAWPTMAALERQHIANTLRHTGYNQSAAARLLGWDRRQLRRKIEKYGLELTSNSANASAPVS